MNISSLLRNMTRETTLTKTSAFNKSQMNLLCTHVSGCVLFLTLWMCTWSFYCYIPPGLCADVTHPASITVSDPGIHERRGIIQQLFRLTPPAPTFISLPGTTEGSGPAPWSCSSEQWQWRTAAESASHLIRATNELITYKCWWKLSGRCGWIQPPLVGGHSLKEKTNRLTCVITA